jgi:hypothetical protein
MKGGTLMPKPKQPAEVADSRKVQIGDGGGIRPTPKKPPAEVTDPGRVRMGDPGILKAKR